MKADNGGQWRAQRAGGVQARPLFAGAPLIPKAIGSRYPASTTHVAPPSHHRGWRSTRARNHQRCCVTLSRVCRRVLSSKAHAPLTALSPPRCSGVPPRSSSLNRPVHTLLTRVDIVAVKMCLHKRAAPLRRRKCQLSPGHAPARFETLTVWPTSLRPLWNSIPGRLEEPRSCILLITGTVDL